MSALSFTITAAAPEMSLDDKGKTSAAFTITNTAARPIRSQLQVRPLGTTDPGWLKLGGGEEYNFAASETRQVNVDIQVPSGVAPGKYSFRLDVCATENPDDDFATGPVVAFSVRDTPAPPKPPKSFPLWILLASLAAVAVIGGLAVFWLLRDPEPAFLVRVGSNPMPQADTVSFFGVVESGVIKKGVEVELVGMRETVKAKVTEIAKDGAPRDEAVPADQVIRVTLKGPAQVEVMIGQVVAPPGKVKACKKLKADVIASAPLISAVQSRTPLQFDLRTFVPGTLKLPEGVNAGDAVSVEIDLSAPVAVQKGRAFDIVDETRGMVGNGKVTAVLE